MFQSRPTVLSKRSRSAETMDSVEDIISAIIGDRLQRETSSAISSVRQPRTTGDME